MNVLQFVVYLPTIVIVIVVEWDAIAPVFVFVFAQVTATVFLIVVDSNQLGGQEVNVTRVGYFAWFSSRQLVAQ
jgi:hypothetical protein